MDNFIEERSVVRRRVFLIAVGVGGFFVFLSAVPGVPSAFGIGGPVLALIGYIYVSHDSEMSTQEVSQFADSVYYLGFVYTLLALCAVLLDFDSSDVSNSIVARFALALLTTLIGLVARVYLVNFRASFDEALSAAEHDLFIAVQKFRSLLETNLSSMDVLGKQISTVLAESIDSQSEVTKRSSETNHQIVRESLDAHQQSIVDLKRRMNAVSIPPDLVTQKLAPTLDSLEETIRGMNVSISGLVAEQEGTLKKISSNSARVTRHSKSLDEVESQMGELTGRLVSASAAIDGLQTSVESLGTTLESYLGQFELMQNGMDAQTETMSQYKTNLEKNVLEGQRAISHVHDQLVSTVDEIRNSLKD
jgi:hypothetical protein